MKTVSDHLAYRCNFCDRILRGYADVGRHFLLIHPSVGLVRRVEASGQVPPAPPQGPVFEGSGAPNR